METWYSSTMPSLHLFGMQHGHRHAHPSRRGAQQQPLFLTQVTLNRLNHRTTNRKRQSKPSKPTRCHTDHCFRRANSIAHSTTSPPRQSSPTRPHSRRLRDLAGPYLLLVIRSVTQYDMADVDEALPRNGQPLPWLFSQSRSFYKLAYADDTDIFTGTAERRALAVDPARNCKKSVLQWCSTRRLPATTCFPGENLKQGTLAKYVQVILRADSSSKTDVTPGWLRHGSISRHCINVGDTQA